jgi:hypothetical protein
MLYAVTRQHNRIAGRAVVGIYLGATPLLPFGRRPGVKTLHRVVAYAAEEVGNPLRRERACIESTSVAWASGHISVTTPTGPSIASPSSIKGILATFRKWGRFMWGKGWLSPCIASAPSKRLHHRNVAKLYHIFRK